LLIRTRFVLVLFRCQVEGGTKEEHQRLAGGKGLPGVSRVLLAAGAREGCVVNLPQPVVNRLQVEQGGAGLTV